MKISVVLVVLLVLLILLFLINKPSLLGIQEDPLYCEMVKYYKDSKGMEGWQDFKRTYSRGC